MVHFTGYCRSCRYAWQWYNSVAMHTYMHGNNQVKQVWSLPCICMFSNNCNWFALPCICICMATYGLAVPMLPLIFIYMATYTNLMLKKINLLVSPGISTKYLF